MKKLAIIAIGLLSAQGTCAREVASSTGYTQRGQQQRPAQQEMAPRQFKQLTVQEQINYLKKNPTYTVPYEIKKNLASEVQDILDTRN